MTNTNQIAYITDDYGTFTRTIWADKYGCRYVKICDGLFTLAEICRKYDVLVCDR